MKSQSGGFSKNRRAAESVDEALDRFGFGLFHLRLLLLLGLVHIADITDSFLTPIIKQRIACDWKLSVTAKATVKLVSTIGICVGCPLAGFLADRFGRRNVLIATCFSATLFGGITAGVFHYPWLLVLRFLTTFSIGGIKCVALVYMLEFLPKANRGKLLVSFLLFWTLGCLFTLLFLYLVLQAGWRPVIALATVPNALATLLATFLPQSPHFLFIHEEHAEADEVLSMVGLTNGCEKTNFIIPLCPPKQKLRPELTWKQMLRPSSFGVFCTRFRCFFGIFLLWFLIDFSSRYSLDVNSFLPFTPRECMSKQSLSYLIRLRTFKASDLALVSNNDDSCCESESLHLSRMTGNAVHYGLGCILALLVIDQMGRRISMMFCSAFASLLFLPLNFCTPALVREVLMILSASCSSAAQGTLAVYSAEFWPTSHRAFLLGLCWSVGAATMTMEIPILNVLVTAVTDRPAYVFNTVLLLVCAIVPLILPYETAEWSLAFNPRQFFERIDNEPTCQNYANIFPLEKKTRKRMHNVDEKTPLR